jgi:hypothetical protein
VVPLKPVVSLEATLSLEAVVPLEAMMPLEAMPDGSTRVTALVTAHGARLAWRVDRKYDRQCGDRYECHFLRTSQRVHGNTSLSPST